jgi:hypothetical protein
VSTYYPDWFELLGYRWVVLGKMDDPGGHITAWKTRT